MGKTQQEYGEMSRTTVESGHGTAQDCMEKKYVLRERLGRKTMDLPDGAVNQGNLYCVL